MNLSDYYMRAPLYEMLNTFFKLSGNIIIIFEKGYQGQITFRVAEER